MKQTTVVNINNSDYDVFIGRPSKWGNPFVIGPDGSRFDVIRKYKIYLLNNRKLMESLPELYGKKLGCYCKPKPCHGDVLVELVNRKMMENIFKNVEEKNE